MKTRVWKLAKELGISSKSLIDRAANSGFEISNPLCTLEKDEEKKIRELFAKKREQEKKPAKAAKQKQPQEKAKKTEPQKKQAEQSKKPTEVETEEQEKKNTEKQQQKQEKNRHKEKSSKATISKTEQKTHETKEKNAQQQVKTDKAKEQRPAADKKTQQTTHKGTPVEKNRQKHNNRPQQQQQRNSQSGQRNNTQSGQRNNTQSGQRNNSQSGQKNTQSTQRNNTQSGQRNHNQRNNTQRNTNRHTHRSHRHGYKSQQAKRTVKETTRRKELEVQVPITVKELSQAIGVRSNLILQKLLETWKTRININQALDETMVEWIGLEFGKSIQIKKGEDIEEVVLKKLQKKNDPKDLVPRAPVVTFMGHVDHGKTSLLDKIRETKVAEQESGGITQHIGAYKIRNNDQSIVFLDTPGHEAFTSMRARGANVTDIVVLVVAADDGVMPQTVEAINHAKAAGVPIVVALNKIDKPNAKPDATMQQLCQHSLIPEKWHGDTGCIEVSAATGEGITELLEYLTLVAEMQELRANPKRKALGVVLESKVIEKKGAVVSLLVQDGTLRCGDVILCGTAHGRIRDMTNEHGKKIKLAPPSTPVEVFGLSELPNAGEAFYVLQKPAVARTIAEERQKNHREKTLQQGSRKLTIAEIMKQIQQGETRELKIVLKTDVHGSMEAICAKLREITNEEVQIKILHAAVGGISEGDVQLAIASEGVVLGFNVTASRMAREMAEEKNVEIRYYSVIYHLLEDVRKIMTGMLVPEDREEITGHAVIRKIIRISKVGNIAGCYITDGTIERNSKIRISRGGVIINSEKPLTISSLKRFKEDVTKVKSGYECGIKLDGYEDVKEGDELEAFKIVQVEKTLP